MKATGNTENHARNAKERLLSIEISGRKSRLNVSNAFSLAHQLVCTGKIDSAVLVLDWLAKCLPNDRRINVLRARCEARQGRFAVCSQLLNEAYLDTERLGDVAGPLHVAIVYRATGLLVDARQELKLLCDSHPELPSLWLFAGDLWLAVGRPDNARAAWITAAQRDDDNPRLIAVATNHRLGELPTLIARDAPNPKRL